MPNSQKINIIDFHTHAFPDAIAEKALENLRALFNIPTYGAGTLDSLLQSMDEAGIERAVLQCVASKPEQVESINRWLASIMNNRIYGFAAMHPEYENITSELRFLEKYGIRGIKFQSEFQGHPVDSHEMMRMFREIGGDFHILFHTGFEITSPENPRTTPKRLARVLDTYPNLKLIAGHFGGYRMLPEMERCLLGRDIYFDTADVFTFLPNQEIERIILSHGADKILFGSDYPLQNQSAELKQFQSLNLPEGIKDKILSGNASRIFEK